MKRRIQSNELTIGPAEIQKIVSIVCLSLEAIKRVDEASYDDTVKRIMDLLNLALESCAADIEEFG